MDSTGFSFASRGYLIEHEQQLSDGSHAEANRAQFVRVELKISRGDGDVTLHVRADPHHTTSAEVGLLSDANQRQGSPAERVTRVNNSYGLVWSKCGIDRGSMLVEFCPRRWVRR